jgi:hypothetical protein
MYQMFCNVYVSMCDALESRGTEGNSNLSEGFVMVAFQVPLKFWQSIFAW